MSARMSGRWVLGLGLLVAWPGSPARAAEAVFDRPPAASAPAFVEVEPILASPLWGPGHEPRSSALDAVALPEPPAVTVEIPPAAPVPVVAPVVRTEPATPTSPSGEPSRPALPTAQLDPFAAALEARLGDPKLPLPPKLARRDREALTAFYHATGYKPLWIADTAWTDGARAVAARLGHADEDGLDPADYPVPSLSAGGAPLTPSDLAEAELKLSAAAFLYARDARGGRLDPIRISALITPKLSLPTVEGVLTGLRAGPDAGAALLAYNPGYPGYRALRAKLAELRANRPAGPMARGPAGQPRVASAGDAGALRLPKVPVARLEGDVVANMERWRWLPSDVPARYIAVNIPEYRLRLMEDGRVAHETRVITGKAVTPTPIFSGTMEYAIVNPSWFIPPSILKKEILPGLANDPNYAAKRGYAVVRRGSAVSVRQPPGPRNALGYVKYMFPNNHAVYLHDTPNRSLFGASQRAFSHGCVRVENPFALGGKIVGPAWTEARLKSLIGYGERQIMLADKLSISLTYFTVSVDEFGDVRTFDDVYGYNRRVRTALGLGA